MSETVVARLTASGRSAVAVVGLCGPQADEWISICFEPTTSAPWRAGQIRFGIWRPRPGSDTAQGDGESVVLTPLSEEHFEIHGHGGAAAVSRIIGSLADLGATPVDAATWRGWLGDARGEPDPSLIAEAEHVLTQCTTRPNAAMALHQCRGALLDWTRHWIDRIGQTPSSLDELRRSAAEIWQRRSVGLHLTMPYRVVLAGPPNVGKSSLVNRIVGYGRSITHDQAGTTRDVVDCDTVIGGLPIRLADTAGIRSGGGVIEQEGIRRGSLAIASADLVLLVVDPMTLPERAAIEQTVADWNRTAEVLRVLNKADQIDDDTPLGDELHGSGEPWRRTIATSIDPGVGSGTDRDDSTMSRSDGIEDLVAAIARRLRPQTPPADAPLPINARQVYWVAAIADAADERAALDRLQSLLGGAESI